MEAMPMTAAMVMIMMMIMMTMMKMMMLMMMIPLHCTCQPPVTGLHTWCRCRRHLQAVIVVNISTIIAMTYLLGSTGKTGCMTLAPAVACPSSQRL